MSRPPGTATETLLSTLKRIHTVAKSPSDSGFNSFAALDRIATTAKITVDMIENSN
jgi:hypothetical protein